MWNMLAAPCSCNANLERAKLRGGVFAATVLDGAHLDDADMNGVCPRRT
jgi:uncharacterized protein YjbI with pentapeptide repeats